MEADSEKENATLSAKYAAEADALKSGVKESAAIRRQGGMVYGSRALTQ